MFAWLARRRALVAVVAVMSVGGMGISNRSTASAIAPAPDFGVDWGFVAVVPLLFLTTHAVVVARRAPPDRDPSRRGEPWFGPSGASPEPVLARLRLVLPPPAPLRRPAVRRLGWRERLWRATFAWSTRG